jgi:hypothetical protein
MPPAAKRTTTLLARALPLLFLSSQVSLEADIHDVRQAGLVARFLTTPCLILLRKLGCENIVCFVYLNHQGTKDTKNTKAGLAFFFRCDMMNLEK